MKNVSSKVCSCAMSFLGLVFSAHAVASVVAYTNERDFQNALSHDFVLVNLDASPLSGFASGYHVEDAGPAAEFTLLGIDFRYVNAQVVDGHAYQIPKPGRDRLILNGNGWNGNIVFDFIAPISGVGAWSNFIDGGVIRAYDSPGLMGNLIGFADLNGGSFGGLISSIPVLSVEVTCDFNYDLKCGVFDIQFDRAVSSVPTPPTFWLFLTAIAGLFARGGGVRGGGVTNRR
ncbi:MAG: hypothetical protein V5B40_19815 [Candidatus Accumulibacter meliphilus]|jgi:hypothetical protein|uniref:hypothetical protein n=1 Tax=Candidatus Accumulibacter meliphilus TaxID=2211374 RepID=UPI002FC280AF